MQTRADSIRSNFFNKRAAESAARSPQDRTGGIFFEFDGSDGVVWDANKGDAEGAHEIGTRVLFAGSGALSQAGTVFVVAKLDYGATSDSGDTDGWANITTWINPELGAEPSASGSNVFSSNGYIPFNGININSVRGNGNNSMDEFRLGTIWADVAPIVPEPSSLTLLSIAGVLGCLRRRR